MPNRATKVIIPLGVLALDILIAIVMVRSRQPLSPGGAEPPLPKVQAVAVQPGRIAPSIVSHGTVTARYELDLAAEVTGRIEWTAADLEAGELVAADQVLLRIDPINYRLALAEAKAALESAALALADSRALKRQAAIREGELKVEAARQRIRKAEQDLAYTEIRAPFNAVVDKKLAEFGQFISTGQPVARLLSSDTAQVSLQLPASDVGLLDSNPGVSVILSAKMGTGQQQWPARLLRIESRVDEQTRVVPVVVEVASPYDPDTHPHILPLGLFVRAELPGRAIDTAVRLPNSALQADGSVFVVEQGVLRRRSVNIAYREGNTVIINEGLQPGDRVAITRLEVMFEGMKVDRVDA